MGKGRIGQAGGTDWSPHGPTSATAAAEEMHLVLGGDALTGMSRKVTEDVTGNQWVFSGSSHGATSLPLQSRAHADRP